MKTKLHSAMALALLTCTHPVSAQPSLGISPAANQSILYWAATPTNYLLQSTTNLASPNWVIENDTVPVTAAAVSNTSPARFFRLISTNPPGGMALIPAGSFIMGNSIGDSDITDAPPTMIYVSGFYMDTNLVTYSLWQTVYNAAIAFDGYSFSDSGQGKATNHPVNVVDWYDCVKWCNARSQLAGLTPAYYTDGGFSQVYKTGEIDAIFVNWTANGFRLPTEAEWEKAARGGLNGRRFPWGNRIDENLANYFGNTNAFTYDFGPYGRNSIGNIGYGGGSPASTVVGTFEVNGYGLYDMAGNAIEWCWDWYGVPYGQPTSSDPVGPPSGDYRILRGGSWAYQASYARCAGRYAFNAYYGDNTIGFRCVRRP